MERPSDVPAASLLVTLRRDPEGVGVGLDDGTEHGIEGADPPQIRLRQADARELPLAHESLQARDRRLEPVFVMVAPRAVGKRWRRRSEDPRAGASKQHRRAPGGGRTEESPTGQPPVEQVRHRTPSHSTSWGSDAVRGSQHPMDMTVAAVASSATRVYPIGDSRPAALFDSIRKTPEET